MINIGQKYKIVNFNDYLNGVIVKVIAEHQRINGLYNIELVDNSLLDNPDIKIYFIGSYLLGDNYNHDKDKWYRWLKIEYLKPLRSDKLKRLLK